MITSSLYTHRYVLRAVIEFSAPFLVGAGRKGDTADAVFVSDANGLPAIPGSSLAGVLRSRFREMFSEAETERLFGFQKRDQGEGSRLTVSWACIHNSANTPVEGIVPPEFRDDPVLVKAMMPSVRDHVRISHKGASSAEERGKFDEQAVCAGHRFTFELELSGTEAERALWNSLLQVLAAGNIRFGGKTRRGYGACRFISMKTRVFDLRTDFDVYAGHPVSLAENSPCLEEMQIPGPSGTNSIRLFLSPLGYWMIGGGTDLPGQEGEADMAPLRDCRVTWKGEKGTVEENVLVIPASSIKGALAHRVAFHYNALKGVFADSLSQEELPSLCGEGNRAVRELFGFSKGSAAAQGDSSSGKEEEGRAGRVFIDDIYLAGDPLSQFVPHVGIDRFTGGARDQVLFSERPLWKGDPVQLCITLSSLQGMEDSNDVLKALRAAIIDLAGGSLQIGAGGGRGLGYFRAEQPIDWPGCMKTDTEE
jgi:CRISPR/Cas system CSM-associated protein Csm3 (group 7 of RAMP superfamily)